jgi:hypothetical protein
MAAAGVIGQRFDRALRARPRDTALFGLVVRHLAAGLADMTLWEDIDRAAAELGPIEETTRRLAENYVVIDVQSRDNLPRDLRTMAFVDVTARQGRFDKTLLLLLGQERASIASVVDADTVTFAASYGSGANFLSALGLSGGMPTLVSVPRKRLRDALECLGVSRSDSDRLVG